ncbi:MAG: hypothetical protein MJZ21_00275 [archaeon]|nr:hypothetical protein [archaeon]
MSGLFTENAKKSAIAVALMLMIVTFVIGYYASTVTEHVPSPEGEVVLEGEWHQASVRGYNNEAFKDEVSEKNTFRLEKTTADNVYLGYAHGTKFTCVALSDYLIWSYDVAVGNYFAYVNILPGCLVVNELFVSSGNTVERYVSISVYTLDGKVPEWFSYWDISRINTDWAGYSAFSLYAPDTPGGTCYKDLLGTKFYITHLEGPLFLGEMELMVGDESVTRSLQGIAVTCHEDGIMAMATDALGNNWVLECNNEVLVMRSTMMSETAELAGKFIAVERMYMMKEKTSGTEPIEGVFKTGDSWKITKKMMIDQDGNVDDTPPSPAPVIVMNPTKGSNFICSDITMNMMGHPVTVGIIGHSVKAYDDPGKYWIIATVSLDFMSDKGMAMGFGKYDSNTDTIEFKFYYNLAGQKYFFMYTFEKIASP